MACPLHLSLQPVPLHLALPLGARGRAAAGAARGTTGSWAGRLLSRATAEDVARLLAAFALAFPARPDLRELEAHLARALPIAPAVPPPRPATAPTADPLAVRTAVSLAELVVPWQWRMRGGAFNAPPAVPVSNSPSPSSATTAASAADPSEPGAAAPTGSKHARPPTSTQLSALRLVAGLRGFAPRIESKGAGGSSSSGGAAAGEQTGSGVFSTSGSVNADQVTLALAVSSTLRLLARRIGLRVHELPLSFHARLAVLLASRDTSRLAQVRAEEGSHCLPPFPSFPSPPRMLCPSAGVCCRPHALRR